MNSHSENDINWWINYWVGLYKTPRAWAHKGENLIFAFEAVASASNPNTFHLNMHDQALMLAGMAVEVMLKAILVNIPGVSDVVTKRKNAGVTEQEKVLRKIFYSHNLADIADQANVELSTDLKRIAEILSEYISWRGRYVLPTEKSINDLIPVKVNGRPIPEKTIISGNTVTYYPAHHVGIDEARNLINYVVSRVKLHLYNE